MLATPALARETSSGTTFIDVAAKPTYPEASRVAVKRRYRRTYHKAERKVVRHTRLAVHSRSNRNDTRPRADNAKPHHVSGGAIPSDNALALAVGALVGIPEGFADGIATALPILVQTPARLRGVLEIGDLRVPFGSGGEGYSVPYGDYPITSDVGRWGARHGALAINFGAEMYDKRLHRYREGMELHAATNSELKTEGCVAVREWTAVKKRILAMIDQKGHAYLHIDPSGARIEPDPEPVLILASYEPKVANRREPVAHHRRYAHQEHHHYRHHIHYARI
jgi:hypothetical protein